MHVSSRAGSAGGRSLRQGAADGLEGEDLEALQRDAGLSRRVRQHGQERGQALRRHLHLRRRLLLRAGVVAGRGVLLALAGRHGTIDM